MRQLKPALWMILTALLGANHTMATEEAEYTAVLTEGQLELRRYEPHIVAETMVSGEFDDAGNKAFRPLFKYISGNNQSRQKLAMTSPVAQGPASEKISMTSPVGQQQKGDRWAVSFMMPKEYSIETLPEPSDPNVILREVPARYMASIQYSGLWSERGYAKNKRKLDDWIDNKGFVRKGEAIWARYDPPFLPWFLRRNEILVPVETPDPLN